MSSYQLFDPLEILQWQQIKVPINLQHPSFAKKCLAPKIFSQLSSCLQTLNNLRWVYGETFSPNKNLTIIWLAPFVFTNSKSCRSNRFLTFGRKRKRVRHHAGHNVPGAWRSFFNCT